MPDRIEGRKSLYEQGRHRPLDLPSLPKPEEETMAPTTWIGIDIAKQDFVAAQRSQTGFETQCFPMTEEGFQAFQQWLPQASKLGIVFEATGPYWLPVARWLDGLEPTIPYACINPRRLRDFAKASPERSKTDAIDAALLVHFAETFPPALKPPKSRRVQTLRALWRHHLELQNLLDRARDRQEKALADPQLPAQLATRLQSLLDGLKTELAQVEREAHDLVQQDAAMSHTYRLLLSIPGIGPKTALTLMSEYGPQLLHANPKQLTRYAGLEPILFESGSSVRRRPRISKQGNWRLRRALYMAALAGVRWNPILKTFYQRKLQHGLAKKSALVAAMRKLLHLVYGVLLHQQPFNPNHQGA
jgi:transposase